MERALELTVTNAGQPIVFELAPAEGVEIASAIITVEALELEVEIAPAAA